jgi:predicted GNAT superfamily acetyltransferase
MIIQPLTTLEQAQQVIQLEITAWEMDPIDATPTHVLIAVAKNGGPLLGAFEGDELIGFCLGWLGTKNDHGPAAEQLKLVSHMTGVRPGHRDKRVGYQLKLAQRQWALARGINLITWTYDPLESRNANLNVRRLGATCHTYLRDVYGEMADKMNQGIASDRFQVDWWIAGSRVETRLQQPQTRTTIRTEAQLLNPASVGSNGQLRPTDTPAEPAGPSLLVEIPSNMQQIRRTDLELGIAWRLHTRTLFERAFAAGYRVTDFVFETQPSRSLYLLEKTDAI